MRSKIASDADLDQRHSPEAQANRRILEQGYALRREADIERHEAAAARNDSIVRFMTELTSKQPFHGWRWFGDQDSIYLELRGDNVKLSELLHLSEIERVNDVRCVFRATPNVGIYIAFQLDLEHVITAPKCHLCRCGHRRVDGIHVPTQRIGMIKATMCRSIVAVPCKLILGRWLAYVDGKPIPDRTWGTANGAVRAARKLSRDRDAGDES